MLIGRQTRRTFQLYACVVLSQVRNLDAEETASIGSSLPLLSFPTY
jgi:hypothetical protein